MGNLIQLAPKRVERESMKTRALYVLDKLTIAIPELIPAAKKTGELETVYAGLLKMPGNAWAEEVKGERVSILEDCREMVVEVQGDLELVLSNNVELLSLLRNILKGKQEEAPEELEKGTYNSKQQTALGYYYLTWSTAMMREELSEESLKALREELIETLDKLKD